jgi:hypothetical protein
MLNKIDRVQVTPRSATSARGEPNDEDESAEYPHQNLTSNVR